MRFLLELQKYAPPECVVTDDDEALRQFRRGETAMVISGPEGLGRVSAGAEPMQIGVADIPVPAGGERRCHTEFRYVCIPAFVRGERAAAALELVKFMAGSRAQEIVARGVDDDTPVISIRSELLAGDWYERRLALRVFAAALDHAAPVAPAFVWEGKCAKDWLNGIHSPLIGDSRGVDEVMAVAQEKGDQALSCLFTDIGHPSWTIRLGMSLVAVLIFVAVAYAVSRR
jgi:ABC-type glycerol-3-phosphate transport system substrate-binding protein